MAPPSSAPLHMLPIASRPQKTWSQFVHAIISGLVFFVGCVMIHATQLVFVIPLYFIPSTRARKLHDEGVRYTKGAFGKLAVLMCQLFAPTTLRVTFETDGLGAFTPEQIQQIVVRDSSGKVVELRLPPKMVIIANHQIYADWWYAWSFMYFMNMHRNILIVLKKSFKWVPVLGWGMQVFRFIFLARSWAHDKHVLVSHLAKLGRKAHLEDTPLAFLIYPEGTVISNETRPISKKYADRLGIPDMRYTLLPRSTGLHYSLRALAPRIPDLKLLDMTVAYPGIPGGGDGQLYYTIRSIFMDRIAPPTVHIHLRLIDVASTVPVGDLTGANPAVTPPSVSASAKPPAYPTNEKDAAMNGHATPAVSTIEADPPEKERIAFDEWLRALWRSKDEKLEEYYLSDSLSEKEVKNGAVQDDSRKRFNSSAPAIEIPLRLKKPRDVLDAFCFFGPAALGWAWQKVKAG
ncbi:hypothetical protein ACEPAF_4122 [Sanghuangporus sanghuang]